VKSETTKEEVKVTAKVSAPVEVVAAGKAEFRITKDNALRNQFAVAVVDYVLKGMDITYLEGHASIPRMSEKVFMLADALVKESNKGE
jgi:hypothetical protein